MFLLSSFNHLKTPTVQFSWAGDDEICAADLIKYFPRKYLYFLSKDLEIMFEQKHVIYSGEEGIEFIIMESRKAH